MILQTKNNGLLFCSVTFIWFFLFFGCLQIVDGKHHHDEENQVQSLLEQVVDLNKNIRKLLHGFEENNHHQNHEDDMKEYSIQKNKNENNREIEELLNQLDNGDHHDNKKKKTI